MKSIKNIILVAEGNTSRRDISPDVLSPEHLKIFQEKGASALPPEAGEIMDMLYLLRRMIDLETYSSRTEQKAADKVYDKMKVQDGVILLDDADYSRLRAMLESFAPYLSGRVYEPMHEAYEQAVDVEVDVSLTIKSDGE
jgi:hypothetical protein